VLLGDIQRIRLPESESIARITAGESGSALFLDPDLGVDHVLQML
jgi:hypothetical protein